VITRRGGEHGETLVELLITIAIMASAIVAIVAAIAAASTSSGEHKKQVGLVVVLRDYAEAIMNGSYAGGCTTPTVNFTPPAGYTLGFTTTGWYDGTSGGTSFAPTCPGQNAMAVRLRLDARSTADSSAHRSLEIVKSADYVRPS
jgi:type II secretory pathway pseudopilin PulG